MIDQQQHMSCIIRPEGFRGGLYLGDKAAAADAAALAKHKITAIVTVASELAVPEDSFWRFQVALEDTPEADLLSRLPTLLASIHGELGKGNVLVHCRLGVSRSAATVIAYLMRYRGLAYELAFERVKRKRTVVNPNKGLRSQLLAF